jgi:thiol-disulfide isomerase/thioredoxin
MDMRRSLFLLLLLVTSNTALADERAPAIGDVIGELRFKDIRGLQRSLDDLGKKRAYVLVFSTTHCPLVKRTLPKLTELDTKFGPRDVQFVAVNVGADDTIRDVASQAIEHDCSFPFVKDTDLSCVKRLGIERTPEVAVLDADKRLVYRGRVDDQLRLGGARPEPTRRDLEEVLRELLDGKPISVATTTVDGCAITPPEPLDLKSPAPTFHKQVAPILNRRCVNCHRPGTAAPFALLEYKDAAANAEMIAEVVTDQRMPPWYANPKHGKFQNDPSLTREERDTLVRWVRTGRAAGDPSNAPPAPKFDDSKWRIGEPDLVVTTLFEDSIPATGYVDYRHVLLPHIFLADTWIEAVEIRPDNPAVVHHCNMAYVTKDKVGVETFITGHVPGGQPLDLSRFKKAWRSLCRSSRGSACRFTTRRPANLSVAAFRSACGFLGESSRSGCIIFCSTRTASRFRRDMELTRCAPAAHSTTTSRCWGYSLTCTCVAKT